MPDREKGPTQGEGEDLEFTVEAVRKYKENLNCPYCNHHEVAGGGKQQFDDGEFHSKCRCTSCNKTWWEIYKLHTIEPGHIG